MDVDLIGVMEFDLWCPDCRVLRIWFRPDVPIAPRCVLCRGPLTPVTPETAAGQVEEARTRTALLKRLGLYDPVPAVRGSR